MTKKQEQMPEQGAEEIQEVKKTKTVSEELEVAGSQLVGKVKEIVKQGNVRRLIIKNTQGRVLLDIPLTVGAAAVGIVSLAMFPLTVLGGIAAAVARVRIEIVRELQEGEVLEDKTESKKRSRSKSTKSDLCLHATHVEAAVHNEQPLHFPLEWSSSPRL